MSVLLAIGCALSAVGSQPLGACGLGL